MMTMTMVTKGNNDDTDESDDDDDDDDDYDHDDGNNSKSYGSAGNDYDIASDWFLLMVITLISMCAVARDPTIEHTLNMYRW